MSRKTYILLPVHNRMHLTTQFVECLLNQTYSNFQLVLIDDGSTDGTTEMVLSKFPETTIIRGDGNLWWGGSLNEGYKWLKKNVWEADDIVLIINDDLIIENDFLEKGVEVVSANTDCLVLAEAYSISTKKLIDNGIFVDWKKLTFLPASDDQEPNCLSTRGLFLTVGAFFRTGGFYPRLLPHYASDYEFSIRAQRKGLKLMVSNLIKVWVHEDETGIHSVKDDTAVNYLKKLTSIKAAANPIYFSNFIFLAAPARFIPINIIRIWKGFAQGFFSKVGK